MSGDAGHWDHRYDDDYYSQPGELFRLMSKEQKEVLFANTARSIGHASVDIQKRHIGNCFQADPEYAAGVASALGIVIDESTD